MQSEKLRGNKKLDRVLELMYTKNLIPNQIQESKNIILTKEAPDNKVYGIFKEGVNYVLKISENTDNLLESEFNYIGGIQNKWRVIFPNEIEAINKLNQILININENYGIVEGINLYENDRKVFLKVPIQYQQNTETTEDIDSEQKVDDYLPDVKTVTDDTENITDSNDNQNDPIKEIQKLTGKLTNDLRQYTDRVTDKDIKYVLNSIFSAIDFTKLSLDDIEDIRNKIDSENAEDNENSENSEIVKNDETEVDNTSNEENVSEESYDMNENVEVPETQPNIKNANDAIGKNITDTHKIIDIKEKGKGGYFTIKLDNGGTKIISLEQLNNMIKESDITSELKKLILNSLYNKNKTIKENYGIEAANDFDDYINIIKLSKTKEDVKNSFEMLTQWVEYNKITL